jgi:outer membrane putative beta-barrel porin/alpha-amylase
MQEEKSCRAGALLAVAALAGGLGAATPAQAQVTLDVIGPHEYDLPVDFKPFNVFVQYATFQDGRRLWDGDGDRRRTSSTHTIVGLSKYVHFWTPESNPKMGLAYEVIVPEVGVRNSDSRSSASGIGDPITGLALWYKPTANSTLGFQSFMQLPVGDKDIGGGDVWKNLSSLFWDVQFGKLTYTADAGFVFFGDSTAADATPGTVFHTNHRVGYQLNDVIEPFVALDYERQEGWKNRAAGVKIADNHETTAGIGVMFKYYGNQSLTVRYSRGIDGESHGATDSLNLKYVYAW